jgi:hypothetical protein
MRAQSASTRIPVIPKPSLRQEREENLARLARFVGKPSSETDSKQQEEQKPKKYQSVVVCQRDGTMLCPECSQGFSQEPALRDHVFQCRIDHGVDPLLQLHIVRRMSSAGAPPSAVRGRRTWNGEPGPSADLEPLMRPIHFCVEQRNLMAPVRPRTLPPAPGRAAQLSQHNGLLLVAHRPAEQGATRENRAEQAADETSGQMRLLDLRHQVVTTQGASLIQSSLAPKRSRPLPIEQINLEGCVFESEDAERSFLGAVLSNHHVERIVGKPVRCSKHTAALWAEVEAHVLNNADRSCELRSQQAFSNRVEEYQRWGEIQREHRCELIGNERQERDALRLQEHEARETFGHDMVNAVNRQLAAERRLMLRQEKDLQRREFVEREYLLRCSLFAGAIGELTNVCVLEEAGHRIAISQDRDRSKQTAWMTEREDVFRSKIMEHCRLGYASLSRLTLESRHAALAAAIEQESVAELEALVRQRQRHKQHSLWRRRKREEVELFIRAERVTRDAIEKEEDSFFATNRDKLHRTVEMILTKYANQRDTLSQTEGNTRDMREANYLQWFSLSLQRFHLEARVVKQYVISARREAQRQALLEILPILSIAGLEGHASRHAAIFCAATPAHDPPPPVPLFPPQASFRVTLPSEWATQMQEAEAKCRASVADEKAVMTDSMQILADIAKRLHEAKVVAFELSIEEIHRRLQLARLGTMTSPSETPLDEKETRDGQSTFGISKGKSSGKSMTKRTQATFLVPTEPITEPHFLKAARDLLRWRCAFADKSTVGSIRSSKEQVHTAKIKVAVDSTDCDEILPHHRMSASRSFNISMDGVERSAETKVPSWANAAMSLDQSLSTTTGLSGAFPGIRVEEEGDDCTSFNSKSTTTLKNEAHEGAQRELLIMLDLQNRGDDSPSVSALNPDQSLVGVPRRSLGVSQVTEALHSLSYRCLVDGNFSQLRSRAIVTLHYSITVEVIVKQFYGELNLEVDAYGYSQSVPSSPPRTAQLRLEGKIDVCVIPSFFSASLGDPRLLVEKQMEEVLVFAGAPPLEPPLCARYSSDGRVVLEEMTGAGGFGDSVLSVEVFTGSVSGAERLSIRDDLPRLRFDVSEKIKTVSRLLINGTPVADVESGQVQSTKFANPTNAIPGNKPFFALRFARGVQLEEVREILQRVRFHNFEADPWEGRMMIRLTLALPEGRGTSTLDGFFDIEDIDKPTELRLVFQRHTFRAPLVSCLPLAKQCAANFFVALFSQCVVYDEDTTNFSNGFIRVTMSNYVKGDAVVFVPDSRVLSVIDEALDVPQELSMSGDQILLDGVVVATVVEGRVSTSRDVPEDGSVVLHITLAGDDQCSIAAVQAILRHIAFCSGNPPTNAKGHNVSQQRDFTADVQIMDNEQASRIRETVSVRGAGHSLQLPDKAAMIEFKEGNPPTRLPNTDLSNDRIKPITTFAGGYILCTVADFFENDIISLRPDEGEYRLIENRHTSTPPPGKSPPPSPMGSSFAKKVRAAVEHEEAHDHGGEVSKVVVAAMKAHHGLVDVLFTGMSTPLATVQRVKHGLLIHLHRDTKRDVLSRKHVVTLLRNLTFWTPNPRVSSKTLRLVFCDDPSHTPSQVLITVDLESIDDATEIRMRSPKKRIFLQPAPGLYPLCPYGRCMLFDADTDYLDGGHFSIQLAGGSAKGDVMAAVLPAQQRDLPVQRLGPPAEGFTSKAFPDLTLNNNTFVLDGKVVGTVSFTSKEGSVVEAHISFASDGSGTLVPIALASYMINSLCFANNSDRLKDTTRQFLLLVRDCVNPLEGKLRISADLVLPVIAFEGTNPYVFRLNVTPTTGSAAQPGSRIVVQADPFDARNMVAAPGGSVEIFGAQRHKCSMSLHQLFYEELQLRRHEDDGRVQLKNGTDVMTITFPTPTSLNFSFGQLTSPKPFVSRTVVQSLLRYVTVTVVTPLDTKPPPPFTGIDGVLLQSVAVGIDVPDTAPAKTLASNNKSMARKASVVPGGRSRISSMSFNSLSMSAVSMPTLGPEDDDDVNTLSVIWRLHDGQNLSTLQSYVIPKAAL